MKSRKIDSAEALVVKAEKDKKVQKLIGKKPPPGKRGRPATKKGSTPEQPVPPEGGDARAEEPEPAEAEPAEVPEPAEQGDGDGPAKKGRGITWAEADTQL